MLNFNFKGVDIGFSFSFFALLAVVFCFDGKSAVLLPLFCCFLHETGHIITLTAFKAKPQKITLYAGGIKLTPDARLLSTKEEFLVLSSGCLMNLLSGVIAFMCGFYDFFAVSLSLCLFNLLPFKYFDGGRLAEIAFAQNEKGRRIFETLRKSLSFAIIVLCLLVMLRFGLSVSLSITVIYIIICELGG